MSSDCSGRLADCAGSGAASASNAASRTSECTSRELRRETSALPMILRGEAPVPPFSPPDRGGIGLTFRGTFGDARIRKLEVIACTATDGTTHHRFEPPSDHGLLRW